MPCSECGMSTPMLINGRCLGCFTLDSPIIDEGWRIVKDIMDNHMEWEDTHEIDRRRARARRKPRD